MPAQGGLEPTRPPQLKERRRKAQSTISAKTADHDPPYELHQTFGQPDRIGGLRSGPWEEVRDNSQFSAMTSVASQCGRLRQANAPITRLVGIK